jgi:hypothetical protein
MSPPLSDEETHSLLELDEGIRASKPTCSETRAKWLKKPEFLVAECPHERSGWDNKTRRRRQLPRLLRVLQGSRGVVLRLKPVGTCLRQP